MIRVKDLPRDNTAHPAKFLYCRKCGTENSADHGDYFASDPEHVFRCCGQSMILATKRVVIERVPLDGLGVPV